jgi:acetate kinase
MDARALEELLYQHSGLLGVSGLSSDMRTLLASDDVHAREAVDLFVYRIRCELGAMVAALGGLDALVFSGGIGEHAAAIRARVCADAAWLGIALDAEANEVHASQITSSASRIPGFVIASDENRRIASHAARLLGPA